MDHLKIPSADDIANPKVYYRVTHNSSVQFLDFFEVANNVTSWQVGQNELIPRHNIHPSEIREARNSFIQEWLFFGLIFEVFRDDPELDLTKFCYTEIGDIERITTQPLIDLIQRWHEREQEEPTGRLPRLMRVRKALDHAKSWASCFSSRSRGPGLNLDVAWPIDDYLAFSILVLGQTLSHAWYQIMAKLDGAISDGSHSGAYEEGWGSSRLILNKLKDKRWPESTVRTLQRFWRNNTIGLLLTLDFSDWESYSNHEHHPYRPYHFEEECRGGCTPHGDNCKPEIYQALDAGSIPLFRYNPENQRLQVVRMDKKFDKSYAIFSHVWTNGFGNPSKNEMHHCQLKRFDKLFRDAQKKRAALHGTILREEPELFWIDTLGIPVGNDDVTRRLRGKVIAQMHNIYKHAKYTIVLDRSLMRRDTRLKDYTRMATIISMSGWTRRLWTLQESVLSQDLYFCFSNELFHISMLEDRYRSAREQFHTSTSKLARIYHSLILEDERLLRLGKNQQPQQNDTCHLVSRLWSAIRWRDSSQKRHEVLALSIILDLDTEELAEAHAPGYTGDLDELRRHLMKKFLNLLSKVSKHAIPAGLIFLPGPHLEARGYGWAPESWLSAEEAEYTDPLNEKYPPTHLLNEYGLEVQLSGFKLHGFEQHSDKLQDTKPFDFRVVEHEWYHVERADSFEWPTPEDFRDGQAAIICSRSHVFREKQIGLLVSSVTKHSERDVITAYILCRVLISRKLKTADIDMLEKKLVSSTRTDELRRRGEDFRNLYVCIGRALPPTQLWQVDRFQRRNASQIPPPVTTQAAQQGTPQAAQQGTSQGAQQGTSQGVQQGAPTTTAPP